MLKTCSYLFSVLLLGAGVTLYLRSRMAPPRPDATRAVVLAMAAHLYQESQFPVLVRRDDRLEGCKQVGAEGGVVLLGGPGQQAATEFVYTKGSVCVHTYLSQKDAAAEKSAVALTARRYDATFGALRPGDYYADRTLEFYFDPASADAGSVDESAIAEFLRRMPRYFGAGKSGAFANMVKEVETPQAATQAIVEKATGGQRKVKQKSGLGISRAWIVALLGLGLAALAIPFARAFWTRFRIRAHRERINAPAIPPSQASSPAAASSARAAHIEGALPDNSVAKRTLSERDEKSVRMVGLLKNSIVEEVGDYAAKSIFAKGESIAAEAFRRGKSPYSAERVFLAGKLTELLEKKHRRHDDGIGEEEI